MRRLLAAILLLPATALAQAHPPETWLVTTDRWGNPERQLLVLERHGDALTGELGGTPLTGARHGDSVAFTAADGRSSYHFGGRMAGDVLAGWADYPDTNDPARRARHAFSARRIPGREVGGTRRHDFDPTYFSNEFTSAREPALVIWPGDTVRTWTLDSGGVDAHGDTRALYGNPQTGPFFVAGARPGDVLVVHIRRLRLNRDWAESLDGIAGRALGPGLAARAGGLGRRVRWSLDREQGVARLESPPEALRGYTVPVRPMLGGLGVAPGFGSPPASGGDSGRFGGNMDYNGVVEGTTVYLSVQQPGALLYLGDGHAAQGDGETTQWALETSLDVEFSVDVMAARPLATPRVESATHLVAIGQAGSLDDALRSATAGLVQWLEQDYGPGLSEISLILGTAVEYEVVTLAGRNAGMAARLDKARLAPLARASASP